MIIGITGTSGAGKGTVVKFLKEKGFLHYSVRDFLIKEIKKRGMPINRDSMISVANDLRLKFGPSNIVERLCQEAILVGKNAVIESIRSTGEVEALRKREAILLAIDADIENRYSRIVDRGGSTDSVSFQEFAAQEAKEISNHDPTKQNLQGCMEMADYRFKNDWTIGELKGKVEKMLSSLDKKLSIESNSKNDNSRPDWDEYFMEVCHAVAKRATCDRGKSGCVIARDKQILVTGYVGSPSGLPHCDEIGHQLEETIHEDGVKRTHCIRTTHAEQNAICQAAKLGVSILGSTLYCKMEPCPVCAKMIINSGVKRVVCEKRYQSGAQSLLELAGVSVDVLNEEIEKY